MFQQERDRFFSASAPINYGSRRPVRGIVQRIVSQFMMSALDGNAVGVPSCLLFKTIRDRLLDLFSLEFNKSVGRADATARNGLLRGGKRINSFG